MVKFDVRNKLSVQNLRSKKVGLLILYLKISQPSKKYCSRLNCRNLCWLFVLTIFSLYSLIFKYIRLSGMPKTGSSDDIWKKESFSKQIITTLDEIKLLNSEFVPTTVHHFSLERCQHFCIFVEQVLNWPTELPSRA